MNARGCATFVMCLASSITRSCALGIAAAISFPCSGDNAGSSSPTITSVGAWMAENEPAVLALEGGVPERARLEQMLAAA